MPGPSVLLQRNDAAKDTFNAVGDQDVVPERDGRRGRRRGGESDGITADGGASDGYSATLVLETVSLVQRHRHVIQNCNSPSRCLNSDIVFAKNGIADGSIYVRQI